MSQTDKTRKTPLIGNDTGGGRPEGTPPLRKQDSSSRKGKLLVIASFAAVIIAAGTIVLLVNLLGGDERPQASPAETVVAADSESKAAGGQEIINSPSQALGQAGEEAAADDIRGIDWERELSPLPAGAFVEDVIYEDFTKDGIEDALVLVRYEGSGSYLDCYIYTLEESRPAQLFAGADISHGSVYLAGEPSGSFIIEKPLYGPDDPNCCPSQIEKSTYGWSAGERSFILLYTELTAAPSV